MCQPQRDMRVSSKNLRGAQGTTHTVRCGHPFNNLGGAQGTPLTPCHTGVLLEPQETPGYRRSLPCARHLKTSGEPKGTTHSLPCECPLRHRQHSPGHGLPICQASPRLRDSLPSRLQHASFTCYSFCAGTSHPNPPVPLVPARAPVPHSNLPACTAFHKGTQQLVRPCTACTAPTTAPWRCRYLTAWVSPGRWHQPGVAAAVACARYSQGLKYSSF
jgi:hypothetical protein